MPQPINLFEFTKYPLDGSNELDGIIIDDLERILQSIWDDRKRFMWSENLYFESTSKKQHFIDLRRDGVIPRNFVGTIHIRNKNNEYVLNLLPKIFYKENHNYTDNETNSIFAHILWWLSGSEKQNYSTMESDLGAIESDFLEILVYIFATYTLEIYSVNSYHYYETLTDEMETVRGQIQFSRFIKNYCNGNRHRLPCTYDSFQYNNLFNKIVKYVASLLADFTKSKTTKKNLEELLFILDEVEYISITEEDCDKVVLNPIYTEFKTILDHCRLFLSSLSVYKWKDDYNVFALLIPSEKLFENFIFTTLKRHKRKPIKEVHRSRPGRLHLVRQLPSETPNRYRMINDIVVELDNNSFILLDTKYKKIYNIINEEQEEIDSEYNISQSDIYQMVSYAVGSGVSDIGLIYPSLLGEIKAKEMPVYEIQDMFSTNTVIRINPFKIDIIHADGLQLELKGKLESLFMKANDKLAMQLNESIEFILENRFSIQL